MNRIFLLSFIFSSFIFSTSFALTVDNPLPSDEQELRAKALFSELRCVVCQGEAIADSPADVARDMRGTVRQLIAEGKSDDEVVTYFVHQYGEKVHMTPSFSQANLFLWFGPVIVLLLGAFIAWRSLRMGDES